MSHVKSELTPFGSVGGHIALFSRVMSYGRMRLKYLTQPDQGIEGTPADAQIHTKIWGVHLFFFLERPVCGYQPSGVDPTRPLS